MNIIERIKELNNNEKNIVLNFCKNKNIIHSKNNNGYFFNIKSNDPLLTELDVLINNIYKNKSIVTEYLNKRKIEQENLKNQIDEDLKKKELEEYNILIKKLTIDSDNINIVIKNKNINNNYTENEWNQYMNRIDLNLKKKNVYPKNTVYDKLNKIIKNKIKKENNELENYDENYSDKDIEEIVEVDLEENQTEILSEEDEEFELDKTEIDAEYETEEHEQELITENQDDIEEVIEEESNQEIKEYQNELVKKIKEKLITKGHLFNLNLDCKLILEEYIK
jgi:hypothetical protein